VGEHFIANTLCLVDITYAVSDNVNFSSIYLTPSITIFQLCKQAKPDAWLLWMNDHHLHIPVDENHDAMLSIEAAALNLKRACHITSSPRTRLKST
jgi:hypothetical protein